MIQTYAATYTGADDLYVVFTRNADGAARIVTAANTKEIADGIAGRYNLRRLIDTCDDLISNGDLTTDTDLVALCEAIQSLEQIVRWDMDGYAAQRRVNDAKDLAAGIVELEATA